ncbi:hypothetical protein [Nitratireductor sp. ZSWI3]|uniref:hypothetical protein n=1 Tax=Nitratireductor sp. ZSWI3 TaxID=2966359 RepID=UPI0021503139|nr:hypothetical protein [Nitratireductor sp. ZSWI3]MCR4268872.1 hypothetical protein [Nitratireductor sp. ZSWI3]
MRRIPQACLALTVIAGSSLSVSPSAAQQGASTAVDGLRLPGLTNYAPASLDRSLALGESGEVTLAAHLTDGGEEIPGGLVWRVFRTETGPDEKLPLVATARGGTGVFELAPGSYLVHAAYGRAGVTKRITVGKGSLREDLVLDAGGLQLNATLSGGVRIPPGQLRFSIYEAGGEDSVGDGALIIPDVEPGSIVRLNAGTYHVVSNYGAVNAVIRSDIRVEAGKLTEATVEHRAADLTLKLVRERGGEAIADTAWSILTDTGEIVYETVGAYASMVLAEGGYTIVAKNRDRIYQRDFSVVPGRNQDVELMPTDLLDANNQFPD